MFRIRKMLLKWAWGVFLLISHSLPAQDGFLGFVEITAQPGDGVLAVLRTFGIQVPCNTPEFYRINNLAPNKGLIAGRRYLLPIRVWRYDGKSIRTTLGNSDFDWAKKVQEYNEAQFAAGRKTADYRKDLQLWVPHHFTDCPGEEAEPAPVVVEVAPPKKQATGLTRGAYPIFGPVYERVPLESRKLEGCVYYIVSGHGGPDPGAMTTFAGSSLCEDELAYDVALRLSRNLLAHGATAYIIVRDENDGIRDEEILPCDKDETVWLDKEIPLNQKERLGQRVEVINLLYEENKRKGVMVQRLVEIHVDSDRSTEQLDVYFYHKIDDATSHRLAHTMRNTIDQKYKQYQQNRPYQGTVKPRDLFMLRESYPPSVFIELGNIRNKRDQARLVIPGNRQLIADWLFAGLLKEAAMK